MRRDRSTLSFLAGLLLALAVALGPLTPAEAADDTRSCVTKGEWDLVDYDMPRGDVRAVLDGPGRKDDENVSTWWYRICDKSAAHHRAFAKFDNGGFVMGFWMHVYGTTF